MTSSIQDICMARDNLNSFLIFKKLSAITIQIEKKRFHVWCSQILAMVKTMFIKHLFYKSKELKISGWQLCFQYSTIQQHKEEEEILKHRIMTARRIPDFQKFNKMKQFL